MTEFFGLLLAFASDLLGRLKRWFTFRRVLGIVAMLILVLMLKGLIVDLGMGADLPILFGIDWGLAIEASALLIALSVRDHAVTGARVFKSWLSHRRVVTRHFLLRVSRRASRTRSARSLLPPPPEDEPSGRIFAAA